MGVSLEDIQQLGVPVEDSILPDALAALDEKLADYAAAVSDLATRLHPRQETPSGVAELPAEDELPAPPEVRKHVANRLIERSADESNQAVAATETAPATEPGEPAASVPATETSETPAPMTDDETLLASLDEATAKAVRVLHRLNPGKTLQELVEYVRDHPPEQHAKPAGKSWFRFGR